jgi:hypothetical protein
VSAADELRELVATSDERWHTLEIEGRTWQDRIAQRDAASEMRRDRGAVPAVRATRAGISMPHGEREQSWHLWRAGEGLLRSEYEIGRELVTVVAQGSRWWRWSPTLGPTSGGGAGRPVRLMLGPAGLMLTFAGVLEQVEFESLRQTMTAGRPALSFRALPVATRARGRAALRAAGSGADEYLVTVDAERGLLLSLTARRGEVAFHTTEVQRVVYDQPVAPNLFAPQSGGAATFAPDRASRHLSIEGVVERAGFMLLVPDPSPSPVAPHVSVFEGDRRGLGPRHVIFAYVVVDEDLGRGQLRITEAASPLLTSPTDRWARVGEFDRLEVRHGPVVRRRVRAIRHGVHVEAESAVFPMERLVEIVASLRPHSAS